MVLETIHSRDDLLRLTPEEQRTLCAEIRQFLVEHVSRTGGHLASNLGIVETTVAIELAASCNPLRKSNAKATAIRPISSGRARECIGLFAQA